MRSALLLLGVLLVLPPQVASAADRIRVVVVTRTDLDANGFTAPDLRDRMDSVQDVIYELKHDMRRTAQVVKPTERATAHVVIEVLSREDDPAHDVKTLHLRLTAGEYVFNFDGAEDRWRGAAKKAAESAQDWIRDNRAKLLATRSASTK